MTERLSVSSPLLERPVTADTWIGHLRSVIDLHWRPGEYNNDALTFRPDPANPHNRLHVCARSGCGNLINQRGLCGHCRMEWKKSGQGSKDEWLTVQRVRRAPVLDCVVVGCRRDHKRLGLCGPHATAFRLKGGSRRDYTVAEWITSSQPSSMPAFDRCVAASCRHERNGRIGLCNLHGLQYIKYCTLTGHARNLESTLRLFLDNEVEPLLDEEAALTFGSAIATPFGLLPEPLRWEFLYAVQQRDKTSGSMMDPFTVRAAYLWLRRNAIKSRVGSDMMHLPNMTKNCAAQALTWQHAIDTAHREWSGEDNRTSDIIYLADLTLRPSMHPVTRAAIMDLRGIIQPWLLETVRAWAPAAPRGRADCHETAASWTLASEVLMTRGTEPRVYGTADMDAIVRAVRERWPRRQTQAAHLRAIDKVIKFARLSDDLAHTWDLIPAHFTVDPARHAAVDEPGRSGDSPDEPFRFIPQPIMDWLMDHIHLIDRSSAYVRAEARALIYIHERSGRRPSETVGLEDNCLTYDNDGSPYLEWRRGKRPYDMGPRLPIHQESHDVIREWQRIKQEHGVDSKWLFPSFRFPQKDKHLSSATLGARVRELVTLVQEQAPYERAVEGADGNLVHFDLSAIDPYAFRHAFAQRLADATDEHGRSTTAPDVLQNYMDHDSFNTTMAYFEVTSKRRKKALASIPARQIDIHGRAFAVDPERAGFKRIAVTLGSCTEPQNVAAGGHGCMVEHACESCPFFLVDPLERDGVEAKRQHLRVTFERARAIGTRTHMLDHYQSRIADCTTIIDGIDAYIDALPDGERQTIRESLEHMSDIRQRATAPRRIDLRCILNEGTPSEQ